MTLLVALFNVLLIGYVTYKVRSGNPNLRSVFWPALIAKMSAGVAVGLVYSFYYQVGDTLNYFQDGATLSQLAKTDFWTYLKCLSVGQEDFPESLYVTSQGPRALLFVKIVSFFSLISYDNYWIITLYFSFCSFLGSWYFVLKINQHLSALTLPAIVAFLFFPTAVFWSAGVIKESLAMASIFFLSGVFIKLWFSEKVSIADWFLVIVCSWMTWQLKYYFAAVFFSVALTALVYKFVTYRLLKPKNFIVEIALWLFIFIIPMGIVMLTRPNFYPHRLLHVVVENYNAFHAMSAPEDVIHFKELEPNVSRVSANVPRALLSGLFRPFVGESHNLLQFLAGLENLALLIAFAGSVVTIRSIADSHYRMLIFSVAMYITLLCIFLTLSTPNFGTLSRYRVGFLSYFVFILLCSPYNIKILRRSFDRLVQ